MTFFDFLKDLIDSGKERLKTPITGAFVFSFLVWNWRPIAVLFFSDAPIGDKIVVVNHEYCTIWAIIFPVFIALFYTLLIPKIMVEINKELAPTKNKRVDDIYDSKEHTTDRRIQLAKKEFELKNIETGNKQIEDFQRQINELQASKISIEETHKTSVKSFQEIKRLDDLVINSLNKKLEESNNIIKEMVKAETDKSKTDNSLSLNSTGKNNKNPPPPPGLSEPNSLGNNIIELINSLGDDDLNQFKKLRMLSDGEIDQGSMRSIKQEVINHFIIMGFITTKDNQFNFTKNGVVLYNILRAR
jgi:hypothetical protein